MMNHKDAISKCQSIVEVERRIRKELSSSIFQRQLNSERAAVARRAFDCECSAVGFDDPARDREAKTGAAQSPRTRLIDAIETIEDALPIFAWDADASVSYHDLSRAVL